MARGFICFYGRTLSFTGEGSASDMPARQASHSFHHLEGLRVCQGVLVLRDGEQPEPAVLGGQLLQAARHVLVHRRPQHAGLTSARCQRELAAPLRIVAQQAAQLLHVRRTMAERQKQHDSPPQGRSLEQYKVCQRRSKTSY